MDRVVNWVILGNPANWIIVFGILYLVALIAHVIVNAAQNGAPITIEGL